jgi:transposase
MSCYIGIDVSKSSFDLAIHETSTHQQFNMSNDGIRKAIKWIKNQNPNLIVLEATGGYERPLVADMLTANLPIAIINPRHVRDFAKAKGVLAKTDKIDASVLAHFAAVMQPVPTTACSPHQLRLKALVARRRQLIGLRSTEKNHKEQVKDKDISLSIENVIKSICDEIERIETLIMQIIESDPDMQEKIQRLISVPGIGKTTAAMLISDLPELGNLNRKEVAAIVGLAPMNRDSGQYRGKRMTGAGRTKIRTGLFMASLSVIRCNSYLKRFYEKLIKNGKAKMVALVATMRKLIVILNTMIKNEENWKFENA